MTSQKVNGYAWNRQLNRALRANQSARAALKCVINANPSLADRNALLGQAIAALSDSADALHALLAINKRPAQAEGGSRGGQ